MRRKVKYISAMEKFHFSKREIKLVTVGDIATQMQMFSCLCSRNELNIMTQGKSKIRKYEVHQ
jgi:hypothetical protein